MVSIDRTRSPNSWLEYVYGDPQSTGRSRRCKERWANEESLKKFMTDTRIRISKEHARLVALLIFALGITILLHVLFIVVNKDTSGTVESAGVQIPGTMTIDGAFGEDLEDPTSPRYQQIEREACQEIESVMIGSDLSDIYQNCSVAGMSAGSIKINFRIRYKLTTGQSVAQVHSSTVNTLAASSDQLSGETVVDPVEKASVIVIVGDDACASNPCKNAATCVDTTATEEGYVCRCGDGYYGNQCQNQVPPATSCPTLQSSMIFDTEEDSSEIVMSTIENSSPVSTSSATVSASTTSDLDMEQPFSCPVVTQTETQMVCPETISIISDMISSEIIMPTVENSPPVSTILQTESQIVGPETMTIFLQQTTTNVSLGPSSQDSATSVSPTETVDNLSSSSVSSEKSCPTIDPDPDYCIGNPCGDNGICYNTTTQYICKCSSGYTGDNCTVEISPEVNHCARDPCGMYGICHNTTDGFICKCTSGFTGDNCTIEISPVIDYCAGDPCGPGGVCHNLTSRYLCTCFPGFTGEDCETVVCPAGQMFNGSSCEVCPIGSYQSQEGSTNCTSCLQFETTEEEGSTCRSQCLCIIRYTRLGDSCEKCPLGTFKNSTGDQICTRCQPGYYANETGSLQCTECGPGEYASTIGSVICSECPVGQYQNETGSIHCLYCSPGEYTNTTGSVSCTQCSLGQYASVLGSESCTRCPPGKYQNETGSTQCADCRPGTYNRDSGQTACLTCDDGVIVQNQTRCDCSTAWSPPVGWTVPVDPVVYYTFDSLCDITRKQDVDTVSENQADALVSGRVGPNAVSARWVGGTGYWVELDEERVSQACMVRPGRCFGTGGTLAFWVDLRTCVGTILGSDRSQSSPSLSRLKVECNSNQLILTLASVTTHTLTITGTGSINDWVLIVYTLSADASTYTLYIGDVYSTSGAVSLQSDIEFEPNRLFIGKTYADEAFAANTDIAIDDLLMWNNELSASDYQKLFDSYVSPP